MKVGHPIFMNLLENVKVRLERQKESSRQVRAFLRYEISNQKRRSRDVRVKHLWHEAQAPITVSFPHFRFQCVVSALPQTSNSQAPTGTAEQCFDGVQEAFYLIGVALRPQRVWQYTFRRGSSESIC